MLSTFGVSWYLGRAALRAIFLANPAAQHWVLENGPLVTAIVLASGSRVESLAVLRLQLDWPRRLRIEMPMDDQHFHFMRNAGMYHHLIEDLPHMAIGIVLICVYSGSEQCSHEDHSFVKSLLPFDRPVAWWVKLNTVQSGLSIAFGIASRAMQFLALDAMAAKEVSLQDVMLGSTRRVSTIGLQDMRTSSIDDIRSTDDGFTVGRPRASGVTEPEAESEADGAVGSTAGQQQQQLPPPAVVALMRHSHRLDEDPAADWPVRSPGPPNQHTSLGVVYELAY